MVAAKYGTSKVVEILLAIKEVDIFATNGKGENSFEIAVNNGHSIILNIFKTHGVDLNKINEEGESLLSIASRKGEVHVVKALAQGGANVDLLDRNGHTPLDSAIHFGHLDVINALLKSGVDTNGLDSNGRTPLYNAILENKLEVVKVLLSNRANVKSGGEGKGIFTPLAIAAKLGHTEILQILIDKHVDLNDGGDAAYPPLIAAAETDRVNIMKRLKKYNCNEHVRIKTGTNKGVSALWIAAKYGSLNAVKLLISWNVKINAVSESGKSPLDVAIQNKHVEIIKLLESKGGLHGSECIKHTTTHFESVFE